MQPFNGLGLHLGNLSQVSDGGNAVAVRRRTRPAPKGRAGAVEPTHGCLARPRHRLEGTPLRRHRAGGNLCCWPMSTARAPSSRSG